MYRRLGRIFALVLLVPSLLVGWYAFREATFYYTYWRFSRHVTPGMTRGEIENRLLLTHTRFWQESSTDFVSFGTIRYSLVCPPTEVGTALDFEMQGQFLSDDDVLKGVTLVRKGGACL